MGKNPSYQFYPKDFRADPVWACSIAARGLWREMLDTMHFCEPYGYLAENGRPMTDERIARNCGVTLPEYTTLLAELDAAGVPKRTPSQIIFCKRMVEDEKKRQEWRNRQSRHRDKDRDVTQVSRNGSRLSHAVLPSPSPNLKPKPPVVPLKGGQESFLQWHGEWIAIQMGSKQRLFTGREMEAMQGCRVEDVLDRIRAKGFSARLVPQEEVDSWPEKVTA